MSKNPSKIASVVKYTVEKNIRNKWFVILNAILLIVAVVGMNFSNIQQILKQNNIELNKKKMQIQVVDEYDILYPSIEQVFLAENYQSKVELSRKESLEYDEKTMEKDLLLLQVTPSEEKLFDLKIISKEGIDNQYIKEIEQCANAKKNEILAKEYHLSQDNVDKILQDMQIERIMVGVDSSNSDIKIILQTFINYAILLILMIVLSKIANDVSQEKVSKSIEYVLTTIDEKAYLLAKVISISITLIVQFVFAIIYMVIASSIASLLQFAIKTPQITDQMLNANGLLGNIDIRMIGYLFVIFLLAILTIFVLSVIQAALSSRTTNIAEASNATILLMLINVIFYVLSTVMISPLKEPNLLMYILSCVPIASMYFIPSMILIGQANIIQIIVAFVILGISVPFIFHYSARFFKEGILGHTNKKAKKKVIEKSTDDLQEEYIMKKDFSKYGFVIGTSVILFIVLQFILSFFITPIMSAMNQSWFHLSNTNVTTLVNMIVFIISLVVPSLYVMSYIPKDDKKLEKQKDEKVEEKEEKKGKLNIRRIIKSVLISVPLVMGVQIGVGMLLEKLGLNYDIVDKVNLYDNSSVLSNVLFFLLIAVLPAIFEELYVRKAVLNYSKKYGNRFAIIASALLFSLVHLNISQSLFAFIMGIILAIVAIQTKSIIASGLIHFLNNGYAALLYIFEGNVTVLAIINFIAFVFVITGITLIILEGIKYRKEIKEVLQRMIKRKEKTTSEDNIAISVSKTKGYLAILCDYSFIVAIILIAVMLVLTQNMLRIL